MLGRHGSRQADVHRHPVASHEEFGSNSWMTCMDGHALSL